MNFSLFFFFSVESKRNINMVLFVQVWLKLTLLVDQIGRLLASTSYKSLSGDGFIGLTSRVLNKTILFMFPTQSRNISTARARQYSILI